MFDSHDPVQAPFKRYGPARLPDPRDDDVDAFIAAMIRGGPPAVLGALTGITEKARSVLRAYSERKANLAVRSRSRDTLVRATIALVIGGLDQNQRESLIVMVVIEDAAARIEVDLADVFQEASKVVGHPGTVNLVMWLTRKPEDRTLQCMGYAVSEDDDGFRYEREW